MTHYTRFPILLTASLSLLMILFSGPSALAQGQEGQLEAADCNTVAGWVNPPGQTSAATVEILDGETLLGRVSADSFRSDLAGSGRAGFFYSIPGRLKDGRPHSIRVRLAGSETELAGSPKALTCEGLVTVPASAARAKPAGVGAGGGDIVYINDYTLQMRYQTRNQSIWESNQADAVSWSSNDAMYINWGPFVKKGDSYTTVPGLGSFGGGADADTQGTVGMRLEARATGGSVDVDVPLKVKLSYPTYIQNGACFAVDLSASIDSTATINTLSPNASADLYLRAAGNFRGGADVRAFDSRLFQFDIRRVDFDKDFKLFNTTDLVNKGLAYLTYKHGAPATDFTAEVHYPVINTTGRPPNPNADSVTSTGNDYLIRLTVDLTSVLTNQLLKAGVPMPPLAYSLNYPANSNQRPPAGTTAPPPQTNRRYKFTLGYQILDAYLIGDLGLQQDFKFTPTPEITLDAKDRDGARLTAYADRNCTQPFNPSIPLAPPIKLEPITRPQRVWYMMPPSRLVSIEPTAAYKSSFENNTSVLVTGSLNFDPLTFTVGGNVGPVPLPSFDWQPVKTLTKKFPGRIPFQFKPQLGGFGDPLAGETISIAQQDLQVPGIGSLDKTSATPANADIHGNPLNGGGTFYVMVTADSGSWPGGTNFYWDSDVLSNLLDKQSLHVAGQMRVGIPAHKLTPGVHKIISDVEISATNTNKPFRRQTAFDFQISHWQPRLTELHSSDSSVEQLKQLQASFDGQERTLYLLGSGLASLSRVYLDDQALDLNDPLTDPASGRIAFQVPAQIMTLPGRYGLTVRNPAPGGGVSNAVILNIVSGPSSVERVTPDSDSLSDGTTPVAAYMDGEETPIRIEGRNFYPNSPVVVNGIHVDSHFISNTEMTAIIPASVLDKGNVFRGSDPNYSLDFSLPIPPLTVEVVNLNNTLPNAVGNLPVIVKTPYISSFDPVVATVNTLSNDGGLVVRVAGDNILSYSVVEVRDPVTNFSARYTLSPNLNRQTAAQWPWQFFIPHTDMGTAGTWDVTLTHGGYTNYRTTTQFQIQPQ